MMRLAFDIGGTFTDFILSDGATGATHVLKVPTSPSDPSTAVIAGLQQLLETAGIPGQAVDMVLHATTVATNAVLERKGAATGLITTEGFRDVLIIGLRSATRPIISTSTSRSRWCSVATLPRLQNA
jgi:N-methylhydantoinase A